MSLKQFMDECKEIDRWHVLRIAMFGAFCGALLAVGFIIAFGFF